MLGYSVQYIYTYKRFSTYFYKFPMRTSTIPYVLEHNLNNSNFGYVMKIYTKQIIMAKYTEWAEQLALRNMPTSSGIQEPLPIASVTKESETSIQEEGHGDSNVSRVVSKCSWQDVAHVLDVSLCYMYAITSAIVFVLYLLPLLQELHSTKEVDN